MSRVNPPMARYCGTPVWRRWQRWRHSSFSSNNNHHNNCVPLLWRTNPTDSDAGIIVQLFSWGRGASGQLGGGIEEIRLYPAPVASLLLPPSFRLSHPIPGRLPTIPNQSPTISPTNGGSSVVEVSISCGLFHSALLVDEKLWIWGKGDGGRLGLGHENPLFVPTLNPNLERVRSVALGGLHSVALNSFGQVFTWLVQQTN
ncbi:hypothetical protein U1Q18_005337 [Sarracenia purpurea var. burkii]